MPRIHVEVGATRTRRGQQLRLHGPKIVFGRDRGCDVRLRDDEVADRHLEISCTNGHWFVRDLSNGDGLFLNRRRVVQAELDVRDVLRLGAKGPKIHVHGLDGPAPDNAAGATPAPSRAAPWLVLAGLAAGVATALRVWPTGFPYEPVMRPFDALRPPWATVAALGAYGALWGWLLVRPLRRAPIVVFVLMLHTIAFFAIDGRSAPSPAVPAPRFVVREARVFRPDGAVETLAVQDAYVVREGMLRVEVSFDDGLVRARMRLEPTAPARGILSYALRRETTDRVVEHREGTAFARRTLLTSTEGVPLGERGYIAERRETRGLETTAELSMDESGTVVVECEGNALGRTSAITLHVDYVESSG